jgi:hypothetical protein
MLVVAIAAAIDHPTRHRSAAAPPAPAAPDAA